MKKNKDSEIQALKIISTWAICANKYSDDFDRKKTLEQIYALAIKTIKESGEIVNE